MDILMNLRDEAYTRAVDELSDLIASGETIRNEEENIRRFSEQMIYVREIIIKLQSQQSGGQFTCRSTTASLLRRMEIAVNNARETIEGYKSKTSLLRLLFCRSVISKLNQSSKEIADVLSLLPLTDIGISLNINSNLDAIIHSLKSMELKLEENTKTIRSRLDLYISEYSDPSLPPLIEAKEVKVGEPINEAYQFTKMLECFSSEMASPIQRERSTVDEIVSLPNIFFYCPLTLKLMEDPVNVSCNHSYERKAVEDYFNSGHKFCLLCKKELISSSSGKLELTPNPTLLNTISEWKQRNALINAEKNAKKKLRDAAERITFDNMESTNQALEELKAVMKEMPSCISEATDSSCKLVQKLAGLLKKSAGAGNAGLVLWCLLVIARFSQENKETMGRGGVIKCLLKQLKTEPIAAEVLLELSTNDRIAQKIIENKSSIPVLVSLLDNPNSYLAENARAVLQNLSNSISNIILIAKSGYLTPFLDEFNAQGNSEEMRVLMAEELAHMQLTDTAASNLNNENFIFHMTVMLTSSLPASQLASLKCIKRLMAFSGIRISFLSTVSTVSAVLCIITDTATEQQSRKEAFDILISLIETSQTFEQESYPGLLRLYSYSNIHNLLEQINPSTPDDQVWLLRLLLAMFQKSDTARDWIISDRKAMNHLFSTLNLDRNSEVRFNALKLVYCVTGNYPNDVPLPPPDKETTLNSIIAILTKSCIAEEVSIAANIISHLPRGDKSVDAVLQSSTVLKAINALISHANKSNGFLENAFGALLRCIDQSNSSFLIQVGKLEPVIVQMLSTGSSLVKQRAAMILTHLARCTPESSTSLLGTLHFRQPSWKNVFSTHCTVHESCSLQRVICLVKAGAVRPLIDMVDAMNPVAAEAALRALDTLFDNGNPEPSVSQSMFNAVAAGTIVENKGAAPILEVLERGPLPLKKVALELFGKIYKHSDITSKELEKFKAILLYLLNEDDELKKKAKVLLTEFF
ncbi:hypothetical protein IEQ34_004117 [Dendrobium chrysotoxum]|uniref:RING-type E3 ubiquitin transferase n=1 Tax=Dendrobium chrysotoxum TaxID=161865 RepID=A0AAV7HGC7_DENCH|nr:hypothetical protein IEQ34_004117 [Dendrobium chrysotoxum]